MSEHSPMGFPRIPFCVSDICAIYSESEEDDDLVIRGAVPSNDIVIAKFRKQPGPKGNWLAYSLELEKNK